MYFLSIRNHTKIYYLKKLLVQSLLGEFHHEAENTRRLLKVINIAKMDFRSFPQIQFNIVTLTGSIADIQ